MNFNTYSNEVIQLQKPIESQQGLISLADSTPKIEVPHPHHLLQ